MLHTNKIKLRIMIILLAAAAIVAFTPIAGGSQTAWADDVWSAADCTITIGGQEFTTTAANPVLYLKTDAQGNVTADGASASDYNIRWDTEARNLEPYWAYTTTGYALYLRGATIKAAASEADPNSSFGITYTGSKDLFIYTEGNTSSTITGSADTNISSGISYSGNILVIGSEDKSTLSIYPAGKILAEGIDCKGKLRFYYSKLTVDGSKSVNGSACYCGISSTSDMRVDNMSDIHLLPSTAQPLSACGVAAGGSLECTYSTLDIQSGSATGSSTGLQIEGNIDIQTSAVTARAGSGKQSYGIYSFNGSVTIDYQSSLASAGGNYGLYFDPASAAHTLNSSGPIVLTGSTSPVNIDPLDGPLSYTTDAVSDVSADGITIKGNTAKYDRTAGIPAAAKTYGSMHDAISVAGTTVTYDNASDILGDGKVSYDLKTNTLTLDHADIDCSNLTNTEPIKCGLPAYYQQPFTLRLIGSNKIENCSAAVTVYDRFIIGGYGSLSIDTSDQVGILSYTLTIQDAASLNIAFSDYTFGISAIIFTLDTSGTVEVTAPTNSIGWSNCALGSNNINFIRGTMILQANGRAFESYASLYFGPGVTAIAATNYEGTEGVVQYTGTELGASKIKYFKVHDIIYVPIPATYSAPTSDTVAGGRIDSSQTPTSGSDYSCTIVPDSGRQLPSSIKVSVAGSDLTADQFAYDSATGKVTIPAKYVTGAIKITAVCAESAAPTQRIKVQATASPASGGTVTGGKTVTAGSAVILKAVPKPGYMFVKWMKVGKTVSRKATLVLKNVQVQASSGSSSDASSLAKLNYIAVFKRLPVNYTLKTSHNDILVSWKPVAGAISYQIANNATGSGKMKIQWTGSGTSYSSINKMSGKLYKFKMRCLRNENGKDVWSAWTPIKSIIIK